MGAGRALILPMQASPALICNVGAMLHNRNELGWPRAASMTRQGR